MKKNTHQKDVEILKMLFAAKNDTQTQTTFTPSQSFRVESYPDTVHTNQTSE